MFFYKITFENVSFDWLKNMERLTPLYAIMNGTENLRFDKEDYFHVLAFYTG